MAKLIKDTKEITAERLRSIEVYDFSLFTLCNPSTRAMTKANIIQVKGTLNTLKELREELNEFRIDISGIDCNKIFTSQSETELEKFIKQINDAQYLIYRNEFLKLKEMEELEITFPRRERQALANSLEEQIKKEYRVQTTVGKLNKSIRRASEEKVTELSSQLRDIIATLEVTDAQYINSMLYMLADRKIEELKNRLDVKINYLTEVLV